MTTYKTPEQIAEQTVESFEPDDRMSVNPAAIDSLMLEPAGPSRVDW